MAKCGTEFREEENCREISYNDILWETLEMTITYYTMLSGERHVIDNFIIQVIMQFEYFILELISSFAPFNPHLTD